MIFGSSVVNSMKTELKEYINKNVFNPVCPICSKKSKSCPIPCSVCKCLCHQKCIKSNLVKFKYMINVKNWTCPNCLKHILPFHDLNYAELCQLNITLDKYEICSKNLNLFKLRENYNYSKLLENDNNIDGNNIQVTNCDYYDSDEFNKLIKTLPKNIFSILHTNIRPLNSNHDKLLTLLANHDHNFDIISPTETWNEISKSTNFLPDNIDGYKKYEGIPGNSQNSGCVFYIREEINSISRNDLGIYYFNENVEFGAKWIEVVNKKGKKFLLLPFIGILIEMIQNSLNKPLQR